MLLYITSEDVMVFNMTSEDLYITSKDLMVFYITSEDLMVF